MDLPQVEPQWPSVLQLRKCLFFFRPFSSSSLSLCLSLTPTIIDMHSFTHIHVPKPFNYHTLIP